MAPCFVGARYSRSLTLAELYAQQQNVFCHVLSCCFLRHYKPVRCSKSLSTW